MYKSIFVTSPMRVGSTWICDVLSHILTNGKYKFSHIKKLDTLDYSQSLNRNMIYKSHYKNPNDILEKIGDNINHYIIVIDREIKDSLTSNAFYMRYIQNNLKFKRLEFNKNNLHLTDKEYVNKLIMSNIGEELINKRLLYKKDYNNSKCFKISYENLVRNTYNTLISILKFLNVNIQALDLIYIIDMYSFKNNLRNKQNKTSKNINTFFLRKGVIGDYKKWLTIDTIKHIDYITTKQNII